MTDNLISISLVIIAIIYFGVWAYIEKSFMDMERERLELEREKNNKDKPDPTP